MACSAPSLLLATWAFSVMEAAHSFARSNRYLLLLVLSLSRWILHFFRRLGILGLLLLSALDSSFLVLPFGNDLLLIALVSANRNSLIWIAYVLVSAIGSVIGVLIVD